MRLKPPSPARLLLLAVLVTATVGAGIFDVAFPDVVPVRPYTGVFQFAVPQFSRMDTSIVATVFAVALFMLLVVSLIRTTANLTTGITISHSGFTPNGNLTGSPGIGGVLPLLPLLLAAIGLVGGWALMTRKKEGV